MCRYIRNMPFYVDDNIVVLSYCHGYKYELYLRKNSSYWWPRNILLLKRFNTRKEASKFLYTYSKLLHNEELYKDAE